MVTRYLVDSDWVIDALNGRADAIQTLEELARDGLAISLITYGELYEGVHYSRDPAGALAVLRDFLSGKDIYPLSEQTMERFAIVRGGLSRALRQQIGDLDLVIGATALADDLIVVTRNLRDVQHIPDLRLYSSG